MKRAAAISVIDDDESVRGSLSSLLRSLGYRVSEFGSAEDFMRSGHYRRTECLISDIHLPGISGIELFEAMSAGNVATPVVFITAFAREDDKRKVKGLGAVCYLKKPFSEDALLACLGHAIRG